MCSKLIRFGALPQESQALKKAFLECSSEDSAPVIVFVSKMIPVPTMQVSPNQCHFPFQECLPCCLAAAQVQT